MSFVYQWVTRFPWLSIFATGAAEDENSRKYTLFFVMIPKLRKEGKLANK